MNEKAEKKQEEANAIIKEISELIELRNNAQAELNDKILDKADGSKRNRTKQADFEKLFNADDECVLKNEGDAKKSDVRFAILGYRTAKTSEEKQKWANKFKQLYNLLSLEDRDDKSLSAAYGLICG